MASAGVHPAACTPREPLVLEADGEPVYLEPTQAVTVRGGVLLAGTPNVWYRMAADGTMEDARLNRLFGVRLRLDGSTEAIPMPLLEGAVRGIRVAAREGGGWDAILGELPPGPDPAFTDSVRLHPADVIRRYWHGVHDGARWTHWDSIPRPPGAYRELLNGSSLVRNGDTLAFAVLRNDLDPRGARRIPVVFRHIDGMWSAESPPGERNVSYVELGYEPGKGLMMATVRADPVLPEDENSLFLWERMDGWRRLRRVAIGLPAPVHYPRFARGDNGLFLTWVAHVPRADGSGFREEVRALSSIREEVPFLRVDSATEWFSPVAGATPTWVTADRPSGRSRGMLRIVTPSTVTSIPDPFSGVFVAAASSPSEIVVHGLRLRESAGHQMVVSLVLQVCQGALQGT